MATCKDCIHERVCFALIKSGLPYLDNDKLPAEVFCMTFKNKADVVEVKHSQWEKPQFVSRCGFYEIKDFVCKECKTEFGIEKGNENMKFCPDCGAKMDLKEVD